MVFLVGQRFGKQVVTKELGNDRVEIQCDCGTVKISRKMYLVNGQSKSCGCGRYADRPGTVPVNVGDHYEYLTVVQKIGTNGHKREIMVRCACGTHKVITEDAFRKGETKSCGCFRRQRMSMLNLSHGQGGGGRTVLYRAWESIKRRLANPKQYPSYIGRTLHEPWQTSFEAFRDYIDANLGPRPEDHSLDRINNNKGYEPGNLRWATMETQTKNRRSNTWITIDDETMCLKDWARKSGVDSNIITRRRRLGWSDKAAIFTPVNRKGQP